MVEVESVAVLTEPQRLSQVKAAAERQAQQTAAQAQEQTRAAEAKAATLPGSSAGSMASI